MVPAQVQEVLSALECPVCRSADFEGSSERVTCRQCARVFTSANGYLNLYPGDPEPVTPIQQLMQLSPVVAVYEGGWRPLGYLLASNHSFKKDLERITSLVQRRRGLILDLACGPGNVTRQIARLAPDAAVIGFDLSPQMLERAVRLTAREGRTNVFYIRGSALAMPFGSESFGAVTCCGALQLFTDQDQAVGEIARVLARDGEFVCQTTVFPRRAPWIVRLGNRLLKFGCFSRDDFRGRLDRFNFDLTTEEQSSITYIFRAAKARDGIRPRHETARPAQSWLQAAESAD